MSSQSYREPSPKRRTGLRRILWGLAGLILIAPAIAMLLSRQVAWGIGDFLAAAVLLGGAGLAMELALAWLRTPAQRYVAAGVILAILLFVWAELAVGLI